MTDAEKALLHLLDMVQELEKRIAALEAKQEEKMSSTPYQRGAADSYYGREPSPHKWLDDMGRERVEILTEDEAAQYWRGYQHNEDFGDIKEWT